ncbi:MAG: DUF1015 domain-containing protein [Anaerolineae bacterium]|nr:DUF1015 domain-containing protein [Anaerolineae bacterium]
MVDLRPLRGWRFAVPPMEDLSSHIAPPYDVISPEMRKELEQLHPHNIVHIDLPVGKGAGRYQRAAELFRRWQDEGVLTQEPDPAFYLLEQRFRVAGGRQVTRIGLIGRLRLVPWGEGVLPHEQTFPRAKADRLALLSAARAHFSPVFMMYSDPMGKVLTPLLSARQKTPVAIASDQEVIHRLWVVTDPEAIEAARAAIASRTLYVADGHHRYETALAYQRQCLGRNGDKPDASYNYVLIYATAMEDPGLVILPTHRCLHDIPDIDADRLLQAISQHFDITYHEPEVELLGEMYCAARRDRVFGLVLADKPGGYLLRLRPRAATLGLLLKENHPAVADMDVAALQTLVLGPVLGISPESHKQRPYVDFEPNAQAAIAGVRSGRYQAAFLLMPTQLRQLQAVAEAGQIAPPKATYFYPKLPSGLVIYDLDRV